VRKSTLDAYISSRLQNTIEQRRGGGVEGQQAA
jgi:hypothetical protein